MKLKLKWNHSKCTNTYNDAIFEVTEKKNAAMSGKNRFKASTRLLCSFNIIENRYQSHVFHLHSVNIHQTPFVHTAIYQYQSCLDSVYFFILSFFTTGKPAVSIILFSFCCCHFVFHFYIIWIPFGEVFFLLGPISLRSSPHQNKIENR